MQTTTAPSEASREGILTALGATVGLALGPSVIANLTITAYITPIEQEFGWTRVQSSLAITIVSYMVVLMSPLQAPRVLCGKCMMSLHSMTKSH